MSIISLVTVFGPERVTSLCLSLTPQPFLNLRHSHLALPKIRVSRGHLSQDPRKILREFHDFYTDLYGSPRDTAPPSIREFLGNLPHLSIADDHKDLMDQPFTGEEICDAIKILSLHKSPGPDGLPNLYYKKISGQLVQHMALF